MDLSPVVLAIPIYFLLIAIELVVNFFSERKVYRLNDALTNISCGIVSQISGLGLKVLSVGVYHFFYTNSAIWAIPTNWYTLLALFIAVDFGYYWAHRMSHEVNLFWGGHVVHHQSEDYNFSVALRQSSFQTLWTFAFYLPLAILGFNTVDFVLMAGLTTVYQFWIHTPYIGKLPKPIEAILNTPSHHRVHHGRDPKYIDKNHAGVFIVWDKLFGTFQEEQETPTYGITKPVNSWNPVWVNFEHYAWMWSELKSIRGLGNKVKYLFNKPGWLPAEMGGYRPAPEVDSSNYSKFNTFTGSAINIYNLIQFITVTGFTAYFLFNQSAFNITEKIVAAGIIIWAVGSIGSLFESVRVIGLEKLRLTSVLVLFTTYSYLHQWDLASMFIGIAYFLIFFIYLSVITAPKHATSN